MTEVIYPILLKRAKSVKDAQNIAKNFVVALDTGFQMDMQKYAQFRSQDRMTTLDLKALMNPGKENEAEFEWLEALKDEKISVVKGLISGLDREIQRLRDKEHLAKPLSELKTEFL